MGCWSVWLRNLIFGMQLLHDQINFWETLTDLTRDAFLCLFYSSSKRDYTLRQNVRQREYYRWHKVTHKIGNHQWNGSSSILFSVSPPDSPWSMWSWSGRLMMLGQILYTFATIRLLSTIDMFTLPQIRYIKGNWSLKGLVTFFSTWYKLIRFEY